MINQVVLYTASCWSAPCELFVSLSLGNVADILLLQLQCHNAKCVLSKINIFFMLSQVRTPCLQNCDIHPAAICNCWSQFWEIRIFITQLSGRTEKLFNL